jgi:hypothetical protein
MSLLDLGSHPHIVPSGHRDYLPWLEHRCYDRACAYCLEHARDLEVDHVEPVTLAPKRRRDPTNLLPACGVCNGPTGKWDYHPLSANRKKCPRDTSGHMVLDPRVDDYAQLYALRDDGSLDVTDGLEHERALWNRDVIFRLNRPKLAGWRRQARDLAEAAEHLVAECPRSRADAPALALRRRDTIVREVAQRLLFFEIFELDLSTELRVQATAMRDAMRGASP